MMNINIMKRNHGYRNTSTADRPWVEHKARSSALFGLIEGFDCDITGEEKFVTPFEKYGICTVIARQGYTQPTLAALYGRDRSMISRYMKEWMPLLGEAGGDLSELDMGINDNMFTIEYCKEKGLSYMEDGKKVDP